ncbi:MAG: hypothetical protein EOO75_00625 [Myxococcales bacterium]|nr:MAG: hypothetical protein EOO75_00625 [Myxococcales bacterium]
MRWSVAVRPMPSQTRCGDAGVVVATEAFVTAVLVDGLGHGEGAAEVADLAVAVATAQAALLPSELLRALDVALTGSRGAVASVLRIEAGVATFAGIGNVSLAFAGHRPFGPVTVPGILGRRLRKVKTSSHELAPGDRLALYTDGVSSRLDLRSAAVAPEQLAHAVIERWGKATDDAGCIALGWVADP